MKKPLKMRGFSDPDPDLIGITYSNKKNSKLLSFASHTGKFLNQLKEDLKFLYRL